MTFRPEEIRAGDVSFLPIVAAYVNKLGIVDEVNRLCPTMSDLSAGQVVKALILDTLSGRSPLYKIEQSFVHQDMELLFGEDISPSKFNDDAKVERNFGFLKDEAIVNSLFLKTPARIEVLGLILVLSLMVWRLMERTMRLSLQISGSKVQGWDKKPTSNPTSLMIIHMFLSMVVIRTPEKRFLANGLNGTQLEYLKILDVSHRVFIDPHG